MYLKIVKKMSDRCERHLKVVKERVSKSKEDDEDQIDFELISIKLHLVPLMQELGQLLVSNTKLSRSAAMAFFVTGLL